MVKELRIESTLDNLWKAEELVEKFAKEAAVSEMAYAKILVSVMEAVNNAIVHGNRNDSNKSVYLRLELLNNELSACITDEGDGFIPCLLPDPTKPENIEKVRGRGVFLMKRLSDRLEFNEKGNSVTMIFKIGRP